MYSRYKIFYAVSRASDSMKILTARQQHWISIPARHLPAHLRATTNGRDAGEDHDQSVSDRELICINLENKSCHCYEFICKPTFFGAVRPAFMGHWLTAQIVIFWLVPSGTCILLIKKLLPWQFLTKLSLLNPSILALLNVSLSLPLNCLDIEL